MDTERAISICDRIFSAEIPHYLCNGDECASDLSLQALRTVISELQEYRKLGTVDDFRNAMETIKKESD